jgi:hypothetical protein
MGKKRSRDNEVPADNVEMKDGESSGDDEVMP